MQIAKTLINDRLRVPKISWKFRIPTIYNVAIISPWNLLFSLKVAYFLTVSIAFSFFNKNSRFNNLKTRTAMNAQISMFVIFVKAIIYLSLYNLHNCTFKRIWANSLTSFPDEMIRKPTVSWWFQEIIRLNALDIRSKNWVWFSVKKSLFWENLV